MTTSTELVMLDENQPQEAQLNNLQENDGKQKKKSKKKKKKSKKKKEEKDLCCTCVSPWLFSLRASFVAGLICWAAIVAAVVIIAIGTVYDDDINNNINNNNDTICDVDLLDGLAAHFLDKTCVAELSCESQYQITNFMDEFLAPLRVTALFLTNCFQVFNLMVLQQGGIPATTKVKDNKEKTRWNLGCFAWLLWVSCGECITFKCSYPLLPQAPSQTCPLPFIHPPTHPRTRLLTVY